VKLNKLLYVVCVRLMPHSRSFSEIHQQRSVSTGHERRASSDMSTNVNGVQSNKSVTQAHSEIHTETRKQTQTHIHRLTSTCVSYDPDLSSKFHVDRHSQFWFC